MPTSFFTVRTDARGGRRLHLDADLPEGGASGLVGPLADEICADAGPVTVELPPRSCLDPGMLAVVLSAACRLHREGRFLSLEGVGPQDRALLRLFCLGRLVDVAGERADAGAPAGPS